MNHLEIDKDTTIIELYAGPGALSRTILNAGPKKLLSIERDVVFTEDYLRPLQLEVGEERFAYRTGEAFVWYKQLEKDDMLGKIVQQSDWTTCTPTF